VAFHGTAIITMPLLRTGEARVVTRADGAVRGVVTETSPATDSRMGSFRLAGRRGGGGEFFVLAPLMPGHGDVAVDATPLGVGEAPGLLDRGPRHL
jgi:hypothetical protein